MGRRHGRYSTGAGYDGPPLSPGAAMHADLSTPTIAQRLDRVAFTRLHALAVALCALGFGFDLLEMMLGSALAAVFSSPPHTAAPAQLSLLLSSVFIGAAVGARLAGRPPRAPADLDRPVAVAVRRLVRCRFQRRHRQRHGMALPGRHGAGRLPAAGDHLPHRFFASQPARPLHHGHHRRRFAGTGCRHFPGAHADAPATAWPGGMALGFYFWRRWRRPGRPAVHAAAGITTLAGRSPAYG